jgi:Domain of unknown function (DU1801)
LSKITKKIIKNMTLYTELGIYEQVFDHAAYSVQQFANAISDFILEYDKDVHIVIRAGEKTVAYGVGPKKMSDAYCYIMPQKDYLNLGFFHGSELQDSQNLLEGTGKKLRHIKIKNIEMATSPIVQGIIIEAYQSRSSFRKLK